MRRPVLALLVVSALASIASLALPWFRHEHTLDHTHVRNTISLFVDEHCSNFARDAFTCRSESLAHRSVLATLYPTFVLAARSTGIAAMLGALGALLTFAFGRNDDPLARITRALTWCAYASLAVGTIVVLGRMPRDPRVEALTPQAGTYAAIASVLIAVVAWFVATHLARRKIHPTVWTTLVAAVVLAVSTMHPSWRQRIGDVGSHEIGLTAERFCGTHRIGCSYRSFDMPEERTTHRESKMLGRVVFDLGIASAWMALCTLGLTNDQRLRRHLATASWLVGLGALAFGIASTFFLVEASYGRDYKIGLGAVVGILAAVIMTIALLAAVNNLDDSPSQ